MATCCDSQQAALDGDAHGSRAILIAGGRRLRSGSSTRVHAGRRTR